MLLALEFWVSKNRDEKSLEAGFPPCVTDPRLLALLDAWGMTVFEVSIVGTITVSR